MSVLMHLLVLILQGCWKMLHVIPCLIFQCLKAGR